MKLLRELLPAVIFLAWLAVVGFVAFTVATSVVHGAPVKVPVVSADVQPMPQHTGIHTSNPGEHVGEQPTDQYGKVLPKRPDLFGGDDSDGGLSMAPTPKFFFGVGILVTIIGAVVKLVVLLVIAFVAYHVIKKWRNPDVSIGTDDEPKDAVDTLIDTVEIAVSRVRAAREKARAKLAKLDAGVDKLREGITNAVNKK